MSTHSPEQNAAWRLQRALNNVRHGLMNGMLETHVAFSADQVTLGDVDHAAMLLNEVTPILVARHADVLTRIGALLRDARVKRWHEAWKGLDDCGDRLAAISGETLPREVEPTRCLSVPEPQFRVIVAPQELRVELSDGPVVFLAGGITGCPDWQAEVIMALAKEHVTLLNPRQPVFDVDSLESSEDQIRWEVEHRRHEALAHMLFWFPKCDPNVTVQPIAMLELGEALARPELPIVVGADPDFPRYHDIKLQCQYARPDLIVHNRFDNTIRHLRNLLRWFPPRPDPAGVDYPYDNI